MARKLAKLVTATGPGGVLRGRAGDVPRFHSDDFSAWNLVPQLADQLARIAADEASDFAYEAERQNGGGMLLCQDAARIANDSTWEEERRRWLLDTLDDRVGML